MVLYVRTSLWACIAVESEEILNAIREETAKNVGGRPRAEEDKPRQLIAPVSKDERRTNAKAAELFNTNRTYINEAAKLKETRPDAFEKVKAGEVTVAELKQLEKKQRQKARECWLTYRTEKA